MIAAFNQPNTKTMNQNINSEVLISVLTKQNKGLNNLVKMQQEQIDIYKKQVEAYQVQEENTLKLMQTYTEKDKMQDALNANVANFVKLSNEHVEKLEKIVEEKDKQIIGLKEAIEQLKSYTPEDSE